MSRKKRASDQVYNERRRARRLVERLKRDGAPQSVIKKLQENISRSYAKSPVSETERKRAISKLARETRDAAYKRPNAAQARKNKMFEREIRLSSSGARGAAREAKVHIFYRATQRIWEGKPSSKRDELIMRALGVSDLEEAYRIVLLQQLDALRQAEAAMKPIISTEDPAFYDDVNDAIGDGTNIPSPPPIPYIPFVKPVII